MTNPNNAVGTNGAFGGRTSVNAFNDVMGAFQSRGVLSGWGISPSSGMTVSVGGNGTTRDVAVAQDASGNKTSVNNISGAPILVTLDSAPASNSRYDAIVAYVDKPPVGNATQDNPECCGIIPVTGTAASNPSYPSDNTIRSAITADGASGATAYYAILGYVLVASSTTSITSGMITGAGNPMINGIVGTSQIQNLAVTTGKIANGAVTPNKIDSATLDLSSITPPQGYSIDNLVVSKKGGVVYFSGSIGIPQITAVDNQTSVFTLPVGWRPVTTMNFVVVAFTGVVPVPLGRARLAADGTFKISKISQDLPANAYVQLAPVSYIAN